MQIPLNQFEQYIDETKPKISHCSQQKILQILQYYNILLTEAFHRFS